MTDKSSCVARALSEGRKALPSSTGPASSVSLPLSPSARGSLSRHPQPGRVSTRRMGLNGCKTHRPSITVTPLGSSWKKTGLRSSGDCKVAGLLRRNWGHPNDSLTNWPAASPALAGVSGGGLGHWPPNPPWQGFPDAASCLSPAHRVTGSREGFAPGRSGDLLQPSLCSPSLLPCIPPWGTLLPPGKAHPVLRKHPHISRSCLAPSLSGPQVAD